MTYDISELINIYNELIAKLESGEIGYDNEYYIEIDYMMNNIMNN